MGTWQRSFLYTYIYIYKNAYCWTMFPINLLFYFYTSGEKPQLPKASELRVIEAILRIGVQLHPFLGAMHCPEKLWLWKPHIHSFGFQHVQYVFFMLRYSNIHVRWLSFIVFIFQYHKAPESHHFSSFNIQGSRMPETHWLPEQFWNSAKLKLTRAPTCHQDLQHAPWNIIILWRYQTLEEG